MLQLDIFINTGIYLFIGFFGILVFNHLYILPSIGSLIKIRKKLISQNSQSKAEQNILNRRQIFFSENQQIDIIVMNKLEPKDYSYLYAFALEQINNDIKNKIYKKTSVEFSISKLRPEWVISGLKNYGRVCQGSIAINIKKKWNLIY